MKKKLAAQSALCSRRVILALLLCAVACSIVTGTLLAFPRSEAPSNVSRRSLTFAERVTYQRAIEEVYWRHRIWPKERPDSKPSLDTVMSQAQLEKKVADYLRKSQALENYWQRPITAEQLQAEMNRMAKNTKQPDVLRELFEALGNDPFVIVECLARPALADRLLTNWYAHDQRIHAELKQRAEADLLVRPSVEQMKQLIGNYSEIELVKSDSTHDENARVIRRSVQLNTREWNEAVQKVAVMFGNHPVAAGVSPAKAPTMTQIKTGVLSAIQEDETRYYATAVLTKTADHLKLGTVSWRKEPLESWLARAESEMPSLMATPNGAYTLPEITGGGCIDDTWTATAGAPSPRSYHTAVWTGNEMIVWGGLGVGVSFNTGGSYNPATDTWTPTSTTNAPDARDVHTAVWTGNEMIVWGGSDLNGVLLNTGGRYNPGTDSWTPTSNTSAPSGRDAHTAVWSGSEMIIWGGFDGSNNVNTGGRYNPVTNTWTATRYCECSC